MKFSIITPSEERGHFLAILYELLKKQNHLDWEWLIYDTSVHSMTIPDERVHYFHDSQTLSIGEKRNRLVEKARGEVIVHCDDDDYYAAHYLQTVESGIKDVDFFNIHSWFAYQMDTDQFYYWDTDEEGETHFIVDPLTEMQVREINFGPYFGKQKEHVSRKGKKGYGFSYAYRKEVWKSSPFPDKDISEDRSFYEAAEAKGFRFFSFADQKAVVVHILHSSNISKMYPQYRIPKFLLKPLFPHFFSFLNSYVYEH